ncbi:MAG: hypothetical protein FWE43_01460 [Streptococcaceae bacterium]|nr:hypothetical protein [Streptococcaceae bacterium]MCL2681144.1 hypothetical protein [Streptococcaceae bacterium]
MLGGWKPDASSYEQQAYLSKYNYYDMGNAYGSLNSRVPNAGQQVNTAWLDHKIKQGNDFVLSTNPYDTNLGKSYIEELKELKSNGYSIPKSPSSDGLWHLTKG